MITNTFTTLWENLVEYGIATDEEIGLCVALQGRTVETLNSILYIRTGYNDWEQFEGDELLREDEE